MPQKTCSLKLKAKDCDIAKIFGCSHCGDYKPISTPCTKNEGEK